MNFKKFRVYILLLLFLGILLQVFNSQRYNTIVFGEKSIEKNLETIIDERQKDVILSEDELEVMQLINRYREDKGLKKLELYQKLQEVAEKKALDIVQNNYFSHNSPTYGSPFNLMKEKDINYHIAGENLAGNINSKKAVEAWLNSDSHRDNIIEEKFKYTAIVVIDSKIYGKVFVQMFIG